jgi:hypothetical protein
MTSIKKDFSVTKGIQVQTSIKIGDAPAKNALLDSATVTQFVQKPEIASSITAVAGLISKVYDSADLLPLSGNAAGDFGFVNSTNRLYLWNGIGWYNIALVNTTPTFDSGGSPESSYTLDSSVVITLLASDPEEVPITYSHVPSDSASNFATITQSDNVFTITRLSDAAIESNGYPSGGTFSITFRASDGINIAPAVSSFTLTIGVSYNWSGSITETKIQASDKANNDYFGSDVAIDSNNTVIAVGAGGESSNRGSVYIFTKSGGSWSQSAKLEPSSSTGVNYFGRSISISGDGNTLVIGAEGYDGSGTTDEGIAYIFTRSGATWSQATTITGSDITSGDKFGRPLSINKDGDTIAVAARTKNSNAGAVYVFTGSGSSWSQQAKLTGSAGSDEYFGIHNCLSADGNKLAIAGFVGGDGVNKVYIYSRSGSTWGSPTTLTKSDTDRFGGGGLAFSDDGTRLAIGAFGTFNSTTHTNFIYDESSGSWSQTTSFPGTWISGAYRTSSVAISGNGKIAFFGNTLYDPPRGDGYTFPDAGHINVYTYDDDTSSWSSSAVELLGSKQGENLGGNLSVSNDGGTVVGGADSYDEHSGGTTYNGIVGDPNFSTTTFNTGAAYIFEAPQA